MKEKIIRFAAISLSGVLLLASVGVIVWIARDEQGRLATREKAALEAAEKAHAAEIALESSSQIEGAQDSEKLLYDIDTLLSSLASDDLPAED